MNKPNELYILEEVDCPECGGEGRLETMTMLTYDGDQSWRIEVCPRCNGERTTLEPVKCSFCGDDILKSEHVKHGSSDCHESCLRDNLE